MDDKHEPLQSRYAGNLQGGHKEPRSKSGRDPETWGKPRVQAISDDLRDSIGDALKAPAETMTQEEIDYWIQRGNEARARRAAEVEAERAASGLPPKPRPRRRPAAKRSEGPRIDRRRGPHHDVDSMVQLYQEGSTAAEIAEASGANVATVRKWLNERGVFDPKRDRKGRGGPKPRDTCQRGHDMTGDNRVPIVKADGSQNGSYCRECKRMSQRKS